MSPRNVALIYVRQSRTDFEDQNNYSPDTQRAAAVARPELDGLSHEVYEDLNRSGGSLVGRDAYQKLLGRLESGEVRYVVCYDLSRLTRDLGDQQALFKLAARNGVHVIDALKSMVFDPDKASDRLIANVFGSVNEYQRSEIASRIKDALATKVSGGELVGPVPAGYLRRKEILPSGKVARTWVEPDPERAPLIQLLFKEYATGTYSFKSLAMELNRRGIALVRSPHMRNNRVPARIWTADVLKDLLANPRYVGRIPRRDGSEFKAAYTSLIDEATWAACVANRMHGRPTPSRAARRRSSVYLLTGVLRCARCGSSYLASGEGRTRDTRPSASRTPAINGA